MKSAGSKGGGSSGRLVLLRWWRGSRWARLLRTESRAELGWCVGLGLLAIVLVWFLLATGGEGKDAWPEQFERGLMSRHPAGLPEFWQDSALQRALDAFDAELAVPLRAKDYGPTRFWLIAGGNLGLVLGLLATRPLWLARRAGIGGREEGTGIGDGIGAKAAGVGRSAAIPLAGDRRLHRGWWLGFALVLVLVVGLGLRLPRMGLSLYNDEVMNLKRSITGNFEAWRGDAAAGRRPELKFYRRDWQTTLWDNEYGANPLGYSVLARLGYDGWRQASGAPLGTVREWPLRLPALAGGMLVLVALALGLRAGGLPWAGIVAAGFWAVHPWAVRYSTEARPYGLMMGLVALLLVSLGLALRGNRWRAWLGVAAAEALALWVTPGCLWLVFALNLAAGLALAWAWLRGRDRGGWALRRLAVATALGAGLFLQLAGPGLPEFKAALETEEVAGIRKPIPRGWWQDFGALLTTGAVVDDDQPERGAAATWKRDKMLGAAGVGVGVLALVGMVAAWPGRRREPASVSRRGDAGRWSLLGIAGLASVPLAYAVSARSGTALYTWYQVQATLPLALLVGLGWVRLSDQVPVAPRSRFRAAGLALVPGLFLCSASLRLADLPKENPRAQAEALGGGRFPDNAVPDRPLRGLSFCDADFYDPFIAEVRTRAELAALEAEARATGRPLRFAIGHVGGGSAENDAIFSHLSNPANGWRELARFPGLEEAQYASWVFEFGVR